MAIIHGMKILKGACNSITINTFSTLFICIPLYSADHVLTVRANTQPLSNRPQADCSRRGQRPHMSACIQSSCTINLQLTLFVDTVSLTVEVCAGEPSAPQLPGCVPLKRVVAHGIGREIFALAAGELSSWAGDGIGFDRSRHFSRSRSRSRVIAFQNVRVLPCWVDSRSR